MQTYDVLLTLGNGLTHDWKLPQIVISRLEYVSSLYKQHIAPKIIVSGKYSVNFILEGIKPPNTEAELMKQHLIQLGVQEKDILVEDQSKDTIGNFYFSKVRYLLPLNMKHILVVCTDFHLKRVTFLAEKILGHAFHIDYMTTPSLSIKDKSFMDIQEYIYKRQERFLNSMKAGDHAYLESKLYDDPYYSLPRLPESAFIAMRGAQ